VSLLALPDSSEDVGFRSGWVSPDSRVHSASFLVFPIELEKRRSEESQKNGVLWKVSLPAGSEGQVSFHVPGTFLEQRHWVKGPEFHERSAVRCQVLAGWAAVSVQSTPQQERGERQAIRYRESGSPVPYRRGAD
jgi:hypothetical protein